MKRLTTLCFAIAFLLVIAAVDSNQSANARSNQPLTQESETEGSETEGSETEGSNSEVSIIQRTETKGPVTQGSDTRDTGQGGSTSREPVSFDKKFWRYLSANNYKNWAPVPGQTGDFTTGQSPHGKLLKMYLNRVAAGNKDSLPVGSIIVKENYGEDESLQAITVMYKNAGYNPGGGDWYWVKYNPDGSVPFSPPETGSMKLAGRVKGCIECHTGAGGDDFVFLND